MNKPKTMTTPKPTKPLSPRAMTAVAARLNGIPKTDCLRQAGYTEETSLAKQTEFFRRPGVVREIEQALEAAGATRSKCARVISEAMDAESTIVTRAGLLKVPDTRARLTAAAEANSLRGDYALKSTPGDGEGSWESLLLQLQQQTVGVNVTVNTTPGKG